MFKSTAYDQFEKELSSILKKGEKLDLFGFFVDDEGRAKKKMKEKVNTGKRKVTYKSQGVASTPKTVAKIPDVLATFDDLYSAVAAGRYRCAPLSLGEKDIYTHLNKATAQLSKHVDDGVDLVPALPYVRRLNYDLFMADVLDVLRFPRPTSEEEKRELLRTMETFDWTTLDRGTPQR